MFWSSKDRSKLRGRKGSVMVEFALGFGMVLSILAGVIEFGYSFYIYNSLQSSIRDAARYASLRPYDAQNPPVSDDGTNWKAAVQNMATYGKPFPGVSDEPIVPGMSPTYVTTNITRNGVVPTNVTVQVNGLTINTFFRQLTLTNKPRVTFPYAGRVTTAPGT